MKLKDQADLTSVSVVTFWADVGNVAVTFSIHLLGLSMTLRLYDLPGCKALNLPHHSMIQIISVASPCNRLQVSRPYRDVTVMDPVYLRKKS